MIESVPRPGLFKVWLLASRPKTLWAAIIPVAMGGALAWQDGVFHGLSLLFIVLGSILIQVGTNFVNDVADFEKGSDTEERLGPLRVTQAGWVSPETMKRASLTVFLLAAVCCVYLVYRGGWPIAVLGVLCILSGILYTAGPYPLGYNGLGDIFVLVFFGPAAVGGTYYIQSGVLPVYVLILGIAPGLLSTALLAINNLRDVEQDTKSGKRTVAVRFGAGFARMEYTVCLAGGFVVPFAVSWAFGFQNHAWMTLLLLPVSIPAVRTVWSQADAASLNAMLARTGKLGLLFLILFLGGWLA